ATAAEQRGRALRLFVVLGASRVAGKNRDELSAVYIACGRLAFDRDAVVGELVRDAVQVVAEPVPDAREVGMPIRCARRGAVWLRRRVRRARPTRRSRLLREN